MANILHTFGIALGVMLGVLGSVQAYAQTDHLIGRWALSTPTDEHNITALQFEPGNRIIIEQIDGDEHYRETYRYSAEKEHLFIENDYDNPAIYSISKNTLTLLYDDETLVLERKKHSRYYQTIAINGYNQGIQIEKLNLNVTIDGSLASTVATYTLRNLYRSDTEAYINLPIADGAIVTGYALDIDGEMTNAVAVEKNKAREAFEEIQDQQIDPGIVEYTRGNRFTTEVYPVPGGGTRTITLTSTEILKRQLNGSLLYQFPTELLDPSTEINLHIRTERPKKLPQLITHPFPRQILSSRSGQHHNIIKATLQQDSARVSQLETTKLRIYPRRNARWSHTLKNDALYVKGEINVNVALLDRVEKIDSLLIIWDSSLSMENSHNEKIATLKSLLKNIKKRKPKPTELQLHRFSATNSPLETFPFNEKGIIALFKRLSEVPYDGASHLQGALTAANTSSADIALLFSDGLSTLGNEELPAVKMPTYPILCNTKLHEAILRNIAHESRGVVLDTNRYSPKKLAQSLGVLAPKLRPASTNTEWLTHFDYNGRYTLKIYAKATGDNAISELTTRVTSDHSINIDQTPQSETALQNFTTAWLNQHMANPKRNEHHIRDFGLKHGLVTPYTSLIVLEDINDYVFYGVRPPHNIYNAQQYETLRQELLDSQKNEPSQDTVIMQYLLDAWSQRAKWWHQAKPISIKKALSLLSQKPCTHNCNALGFDHENSLVEEVWVAGMRASDNPNDANNTINLTPWAPNAPYLTPLKAVAPPLAYEQYLKLRENYRESPTFYMDVSHYLLQLQRPQEAFLVISNILEIHPENAGMERMVAYNLMQSNELTTALVVLEHIAQIAPHQPASWRDLALTWEAIGRHSSDISALANAVEYYLRVILGPWEAENYMRITALTELNHLLNLHPSLRKNAQRLDDTLLENFELDIRIVLSWNSRNADLDLWIEEPSKEDVHYGNPVSVAHGYLPFDAIDGFGPEEYLTRFAMPGQYKIETSFYSENQIEYFGPVTATLDVYTHYGRANETHRTITLHIEEPGDNIPLGDIEFFH